MGLVTAKVCDEDCPLIKLGSAQLASLHQLAQIPPITPVATIMRPAQLSCTEFLCFILNSVSRYSVHRTLL